MRVVELGPRCTGSMKGTSTERPPGALSLAEAWRLGGFLAGGAVLSWKLLRPCAWETEGGDGDGEIEGRYRVDAEAVRLGEIWEMYGTCMGDVWEVYGRGMGDMGRYRPCALASSAVIMSSTASCSAASCSTWGDIRRYTEI